MRYSILRAGLLTAFAAAIALCIFWYWPRPASSTESICYGTTSDGRLERGVRLPPRGPNFVAYGAVPVLLGRTYVHGTVAQVVVEAYRALEASHPETVFQYAETGLATGGRFRPHKTHRNGLSVDFMVPVLDADGRSVHLPTHPFNRYGYDIEFDARGRFGDQRIDFEALGAHLLALDNAAQARGIGISRVIFDPQLQPLLFASAPGAEVRRRMRFSTRPAWVRHDEHIHVDFRVPCEP